MARIILLLAFLATLIPAESFPYYNTKYRTGSYKSNYNYPAQISEIEQAKPLQAQNSQQGLYFPPTVQQKQNNHAESWPVISSAQEKEGYGQGIINEGDQGIQQKEQDSSIIEESYALQDEANQGTSEGSHIGNEYDKEYGGDSDAFNSENEHISGDNNVVLKDEIEIGAGSNSGDDIENTDLHRDDQGSVSGGYDFTGIEGFEDEDGNVNVGYDSTGTNRFKDELERVTKGYDSVVFDVTKDNHESVTEGYDSVVIDDSKDDHGSVGEGDDSSVYDVSKDDHGSGGDNSAGIVPSHVDHISLSGEHDFSGIDHESGTEVYDTSGINVYNDEQDSGYDLSGTSERRDNSDSVNRRYDFSETDGFEGNHGSFNAGHDSSGVNDLADELEKVPEGYYSAEIDLSGDHEGESGSGDSIDINAPKKEHESFSGSSYPNGHVGSEIGEDIDPYQFSNLGEGIDPLLPESEKSGYGSSSGKSENDGGFFSTLYKGIKEKFHGIAKKTKGIYRKTVDEAKKASKDLGRSFGDIYYDLNLHLTKLLEKFKTFISSFGEYVQTGSSYVLTRFSNVLSEARCAEILLKLEQKMRNGDEEISKFFQIVGEKVSEWAKEHKAHDHTVDEGLYQSENNQQDLSQHFEDADFPDLFQDPDVHQELKYLVKENVLKQEEMEILTQQRNTDW